ncbi:MAG: hypothetical protein LBK76_03435 [Verrucomicrobiales bacterium]|jgi:hypothetical protein|nr:hypothetical protein [Verrucomicrobiales bacterium]
MSRQQIGTVTAVGRLIDWIQNSVEDVAITKTGKTHTVNGACQWAEWEHIAPQYGDADPSYPGELVLREVLAKKSEGQGSLCKLKLVYGAPDGDDIASGMPGTDIREDAATIEVSIMQHPRFGSIAGTPEAPRNGAIWEKCRDVDGDKEWHEFRGFEAGSQYHGVTSYLVGSKTRTTTTYYSTRPATDALGVRTSSGWLRTGSSAGKDGRWYTKRNTELYSAAGWDATIYS